MKTYLNVNFRLEIDNAMTDRERKCLVDAMTEIAFNDGKVKTVLEVKNDYRQGKEYEDR